MKKFLLLLIVILTAYSTAANVYAGSLADIKTALYLNKLPAPVSNHPSGSTITEDDQIILSIPQPIPNAIIEMSAIDPSTYSDVPWIHAPAVIEGFSGGVTYGFWAKTTIVGDSRYADSDPIHFIYYIRPTQIVLKITMNQLQYTIDGVPAMFDVAPYLDTKANRSMIPSRFIAEAFGATVDWDDASQTQTILLNNNTFKFVANIPLPDGMGTPMLVKDRFFVPLYYTASRLGFNIDWDEATQTDTIIYYK